MKAAAAGKFQFVLRASDGKLLIGQANAQLRVQNGITGIQRVTIGGVAQAPGSVGLEAFETQLPPDRRRPDEEHGLRLYGANACNRIVRAFPARRRESDEELLLELRQVLGGSGRAARESGCPGAARLGARSWWALRGPELDGNNCQAHDKPGQNDQD